MSTAPSGETGLLSESRRRLLELLLEQGREDPASDGTLSFVEERMWASEKLIGRALGGPITFYARLNGRLDVPALQRAVGEIFRRHEILRTIFPGATEPRALVQQVWAEQVPVHDLSHLPPDERQVGIDELLRDESATPMRTDTGPLVRFGLVRLSETEHIFIHSCHHIITDGHSNGVFWSELAALYESFHKGGPPQLPAPEAHYREFARWQRSEASTAAVQEQIRYWKQQLGGQIPILELPGDRPRPPERSFECGVRDFRFSEQTTTQIQSFSREALVTPLATLLAGFLILLHRCTGQEDIAVGTPVSNRRQRRFTGVMGCFMQPLVLRNDLSGDPSFREFVGKVWQTCLGAYKNQDAPFELLVRELRPTVDAIHTPLFQVLFNVQRLDVKSLGTALGDVGISDQQVLPTSATLDLTANVWVGGPEVMGSFDYAAELFDSGTIDWLVRSYEGILAEALADPDRSLSRIQVRNRQPVRLDTDRARAARMSSRRQELLSLLAGIPLPDAPSDAEVAVCSFGQERLWFFEQLLPDRALFNQTHELILEGRVDEDALRKAIAAMVARHEALRTGFESRGARPVQVIHGSTNADLVVRDLTKRFAGSGAKESWRRLEEMNSRPFDLSKPPLFRLELHRFAEDRHILAVTGHHLIGDGWSRRVINDELAVFYAAFVTGTAPELPELEIQYRDFADWQRRRYRELLVQGQLAYWTHQLRGELVPLELPQDRPRPAGLSYNRNDSYIFRPPEGLDGLLARMREEEAATPFVVWLSALYVLLYRYTGQSDIVIDSGVSGRHQREVEGLIGFFVNSLLLRVDLSELRTFREVVARVRQVSLEGLSNQEVPLDKVIAQFELASGRRGQAVTPVSFVLQDDLEGALNLGPDLVVRPGRHILNDEFDVTFAIWKIDSAFRGEIQYDPRLFDRATVARLAGHYRNLMAEAAVDPDTPIRRLKLLDEGELRRLVADFNDRPVRESGETCIHDLVDAHAQSHPDSVAVIAPVTQPGGEDSTISYRDLSQRSNRLARFLRTSGVGSESRVGISLERSVDLIVAVLAVMKSGGVFVALDHTQGPDRLRYQVSDSRCTLILSARGLLNPGDHPDVEVIDLEERRAEIDLLASDPPDRVLSGQLAYLVYTSGSTGRPKAVMVTHRSLMGAFNAWSDDYGLDQLHCHLQMANFSFDVFVGDLARALGSGATLVLCPRETLLVAPELLQLIRRYRVDCAEFVPAVVRSLVEHMNGSEETLEPLRVMIIGSDLWYLGEHRRLRELVGDGVRLVHSYGVAEATIDSSWSDESHAGLPDDALVPIGIPFAGSRLLVLDRDLNPVPEGVAGELYIAGSGVARGYADQPGLTGQRFVPYHLGPPGERMYRTGDRVRHLPGGGLSFLGRIDNQVKIRGMRVEPGEVEVRLSEHPDVLQAAVVVLDDGRAGRRLVAYVALRGTGSEESADPGSELRRHLRERLPEYMVPSAIVVMDALPLSPNGKVDRRALPKPPAGEGRSLTSPQTETELAVAEIWCEVLRLPQVSIEDNFFDVGGHSLLLFELQNKLSSRFNRPVAIIDLFRWTTVQEQARHLQDEQQKEPASELAPSRARKQQRARRTHGKRVQQARTSVSEQSE